MRLAIGLFVFMIASCFGHIFATLLLAITIFILSFWTGVLFVKALRRNDGSVFAADELFAETAVKRLIVIVILVAMVSSTTIVFSLQAFEEIAISVTTVSVSTSGIPHPKWTRGLESLCGGFIVGRAPVA
jgi:hypothetical protein